MCSKVILSFLPFELYLTPRTEQRLYTYEQALEVLDYQDSVLLSDLESNLRLAWNLPQSSQDRAVWLMHSSKLQSWLTTISSSAIFINGSLDNSTRQSPTSFVCARLLDAQSLGAEDKAFKQCSIFAYAFFCGQHANPTDPDFGPCGILRNLLSQLLASHREFEISTVQSLLQIDPNDIEELCNTFLLLIEQLPPQHMVYCIVDNITLYEDSPVGREEVSVFVQMLLGVVESCTAKNCLFKILVRSPGVSRAMYQNFDAEDVLWMPKRVDTQGGFSSMKWSDSIGQCVDDLASDI